MLSKSRNGSRKVRSNSKKQTNRGGGYSKKSVRSKSRSKSRKPLRSKSKKSLRSKSRKPLGRSKKQIKKISGGFFGIFEKKKNKPLVPVPVVEVEENITKINKDKNKEAIFWGDNDEYYFKMLGTRKCIFDTNPKRKNYMIDNKIVITIVEFGIKNNTENYTIHTFNKDNVLDLHLTIDHIYDNLFYNINGKKFKNPYDFSEFSERNRETNNWQIFKSRREIDILKKMNDNASYAFILIENFCNNLLFNKLNENSLCNFLKPVDIKFLHQQRYVRDKFDVQYLNLKDDNQLIVLFRLRFLWCLFRFIEELIKPFYSNKYRYLFYYLIEAFKFYKEYEDWQIKGNSPVLTRGKIYLLPFIGSISWKDIPNKTNNKNNNGTNPNTNPNN